MTVRPPTPRTRPTLLAALLALALAACAGLPERTPLPQPKAPSAYASVQSFAAAPAAWPSDDWWRAYADPQLDRLVDEALAASPTLAVAEARLRQALAATQVADAARAPQLSASTSITEQQQSRNHLSPSNATPAGWHSYGRASLDFSWELDFWGRERAAVAAATSDAEAARADAAQARLVLASAVAAAYAELARLHAARDTAQAAYEVRAKTAELFAERRANGLETLGSVRQVEARRASAQAEVLSLDEQLALERQRLAALLGAGPDRALAIARPQVDLARPFGLPERLAVELLGRRPDVVAARWQAEAAAARIEAQRAAFYPNVNLVAFLGLQSLGLDRLTHDGSGIGSVGPAISLPLFDGGRLRGQLRGAEAAYALAVANYDATLLQALHSVGDAATSLRALGPQIARADEAVEAAREAWRVQQQRYGGGLSTYLEVLSAEDTWLADRRTQSDLRARAFSLDVALVRALGGGYTTPTLSQ